jgi:hypothetical protein
MPVLWAAIKFLRGLPREVWLSVGIFALLLALVALYQREIRQAESRGRTNALADARMATLTWPAERAQWQRRLDSLQRETATRDTVLVRSIRTVTEVLRDTLRDTVTMYVDLKQACTALANDCAAFRETATATIATAVEKAKVDSVAVQSLSLRLVAKDDDYAALRRSVQRQATWRTVERSACVGVLAWSVLR